MRHEPGNQGRLPARYDGPSQVLMRKYPNRFHSAVHDNDRTYTVAVHQGNGLFDNRIRPANNRVFIQGFVYMRYVGRLIEDCSANGDLFERTETPGDERKEK